jgi:transposase
LSEQKWEQGVASVRVTTLLNRMIGLPGAWVKGCRFEGENLIVEVRRKFELLTCPECGLQVRGRFEERERRWRHYAVLGHPTYIEGPIRRLRCHECVAVRTERVPWARPGSVFTRAFEDAVGYMAQLLNHTAVAELTGIAWVTVGSIASRLVAEQLSERRFEGVRRIGVDEISYRKHRKFLTVVVDHDRECVIWVGEGKSSETLGEFFRELGEERSRQLQQISVDMSAAFVHAIRQAAPHAEIVFDRFHVARLSNFALDEVRAEQLRKVDRYDRPTIKGAKWVLLKRATDLDGRESKKLAAIAQVNQPLYRAHLLKESFLEIFTCRKVDEARQRFEDWMRWAQRSRLKPFLRLARTTKRHLDGILAFIESGLTNARLEGMNNKIRLLSHRAYGFHSAKPLIATIYLCCGGIILPQLQLI